MYVLENVKRNISFNKFAVHRFEQHLNENNQTEMSFLLKKCSVNKKIGVGLKRTFILYYCRITVYFSSAMSKSNDCMIARNSFLIKPI